MIVSLEAILLSTFVMISQNRADAKREFVARWRSRRSLAVKFAYGRAGG
jgi:uncharacterized membrane protein